MEFIPSVHLLTTFYYTLTYTCLYLKQCSPSCFPEGAFTDFDDFGYEGQ